MGKGSPIVKCRVSPLILAAMFKAIRGRRSRRTGEPLTMSEFIQHAISAELSHRGRSAKSSSNRKAKKQGVSHPAKENN